LGITSILGAFGIGGGTGGGTGATTGAGAGAGAGGIGSVAADFEEALAGSPEDLTPIFEEVSFISDSPFDDFDDFDDFDESFLEFEAFEDEFDF